MRRVQQWRVNGMCIEEGEGARRRHTSEQPRAYVALLPLGLLDELAGERKRSVARAVCKQVSVFGPLEKDRVSVGSDGG